jgi:hypothetical protein
MIFQYGKYKGYKLTDVEQIDPGYIRWAKQNASNLIPKVHHRAQEAKELRELDEISDYHSLRDLRHILLRNPGKIEDAF